MLKRFVSRAGGIQTSEEWSGEMTVGDPARIYMPGKEFINFISPNSVVGAYGCTPLCRRSAQARRSRLRARGGFGKKRLTWDRSIRRMSARQFLPSPSEVPPSPTPEESARATCV